VFVLKREHVWTSASLELNQRDLRRPAQWNHVDLTARGIMGDGCCTKRQL